MKNLYLLKEISNWTTDTIPAFQRKLVWTPNQIEILWDSILRKFPIGGFILSYKTDIDFYILDGQQRWNAISLGFNPNENCVLWFDLKPNKKTTTRQFFIMATTKAHPWGFMPNENSDLLEAKDREFALKTYWPDNNTDIYNSDFNLFDCYPIKASFPIPLNILLSSDYTSVETFIQSIIKQLPDIKSKSWHKKFDNKKNEIIKLLGPYYNTFKYALNNYYISGNIILESAISSELSIEAIERKDDEEITLSGLELLFNRLNTQGSPISNDDLFYSSIKAYWEDIKIYVENAAQNRLPPEKLVILLFRLALTLKEEKNDAFINTPTVTKIRNISLDKQMHDYIYQFIKDNSLSLIQKVEEKLVNIPHYIRMQIISKKPDIYLLLLFFAYKQCDFDYESLALFLYWFTKPAKQRDSKYITKGINYIYYFYLQSETSREPINAIRTGISYLLTKNLVYYIFKSEDFSVEDITDFTTEDNYPSNEDWISFWEYVSSDKDKSFLLYAQKDFINQHFSKYNPSNVKDWENHNRPWDYDHIIPQSWRKPRQNPRTNMMDYWLWKTGNFAAIPASINRSINDKQNYSDDEKKKWYSYYQQNAKDLLFINDFITITPDVIYKNQTLQNENEMCEKFANLVFERTKNIYDICYEKIKIWIPGNNNVAPFIHERKNYCLKINKGLPKTYDSSTEYYSSMNDLDYIITDTDNQFWSSEEVIVSVPLKKYGFKIAFSWVIGGSFGIGIRWMQENTKNKRLFSSKRKDFVIQHPDYDILNGWWRLYKEFNSIPSEKTLIKEIKILYKYFS